MKRKVPLAVTALLLALAAASCVFGISRGEVRAVINKSVNICMECIGLG